MAPPGVWGLKADRFPTAHELLDFFHGSEHLWELGRVWHGEDSPGLPPWAEARLHRLRHGREREVLEEIAGLKRRRRATGQKLAQEQHYFTEHAGRMNYQAAARRGWPIGSGAVESACRQQQNRFKRCGQFWTRPGLRNLAALTEARHNHHWDQLWLTA